MQLVIFGIVAVVAVIFLILFNLKSMGGAREKRMPAPPKEEVVVPEDKPNTADMKLLQDLPATLRNQEYTPTDTDYRTALRAFAGKMEEEEDADDRKFKQQPLNPDQEYREALRSMSKED